MFCRAGRKGFAGRVEKVRRTGVGNLPGFSGILEPVA